MESIARRYGGSVLLVVILRSAIEAVESICHHQARTVSGVWRLLPAHRKVGGAALVSVVEECAHGCLGWRGFWLAHSSSSPAHENLPLCMNERIRPIAADLCAAARVMSLEK